MRAEQNPEPGASSSDTHALCDRLRRIPVAVASDTLAAMGIANQVLANTLRPLESLGTFAGPAVCFSGAATPSTSVPENLELVYEADRRILAGCVVVIATKVHGVGAVIGGNTIASWRKRACAALVTDGLIRDTNDFSGMPSYVAGVTPMNNRGRWSYHSLDTAVEMPGQSAPTVIVRPGDVIHGDRDGVVVIPREYLAQCVHDAEIVAAVEGRMRAEIEAGVDRERVYKSNDRFGHIKSVSQMR